MPTNGKVYLGEILISGAPIEVSEDSPLPVSDGMLRNLMRGILNMLQSPLGYDANLKRYRNTVTVEGGTVGTVNAVSTVSNITTMGGDQSQLLVRGANQTAWALNMRSRIT